MEVKENQIWSYYNNKLDEDSLVIIRKIEASCIHVTITNVLIDGDFIELAHVPINHEKLMLSLKENQNDNFEMKDSFNEGYQEWLKAEGGIWNLSLGEVVNSIRNSLG